MKRVLLLLILSSPTLFVFGNAPSSVPLDIKVRPLEVALKNGAGLPEGRREVYDEAAGVFHVKLPAVGNDGLSTAVEITKVNAGSRKPVVFRLSGVPVWYGLVGSPLALTVGGKRYLIDLGDAWFYEKTGVCDRGLFRVERDGEVVTVGFTERGRMLLRPGAEISFDWRKDW